MPSLALIVAASPCLPLAFTFLGKPAKIRALKPTVKASQRPTNGFTSLYRHQDGLRGKNDSNRRRLAALIKMFGLSPSAVARAAGVSPAYISRILSETDPLVGSAQFYRRLEACLGQLVEQRQQQFFRVAPLNVRSVERAMRDVLDMAA